jgi:hypothetical protein
MREAVAAQVRAELARKRISQTWLAPRLNMTQQKLSRRLTGVTPFEVTELLAIAAELDVPVTDLLPATGDTTITACVASLSSSLLAADLDIALSQAVTVAA